MAYIVALITVTAVLVSVANIVAIRRNPKMKWTTRAALAGFPAEVAFLFFGWFISIIIISSLFTIFVVCASALAVVATGFNLASLFRETDLKLVRLVAVNLALWIPAGLAVFALCWLSLFFVAG